MLYSKSIILSIAVIQIQMLKRENSHLQLKYYWLKIFYKIPKDHLRCIA